MFVSLRAIIAKCKTRDFLETFIHSNDFFLLSTFSIRFSAAFSFPLNCSLPRQKLISCDWNIFPAVAWAKWGIFNEMDKKPRMMLKNMLFTWQPLRCATPDECLSTYAIAMPGKECGACRGYLYFWFFFAVYSTAYFSLELGNLLIHAHESTHVNYASESG